MAGETSSVIESVIQTLDPRGLYLSLGGVPDRDSALALLKRLEAWVKDTR